MKINKKTSSNPTKKILLITIISIVVVLAAGATYLYGFKGSLFGWTPLILTQDDDQTKEIDSEQDASKPTNTQNGIQEEPSKGTDPTTTVPENLTIIFSAVNQNENSLQIRALIEAVIGSGECTLTLTGIGPTVTRSASIQALANSSTCTGFDIPLSELPAGQWKLRLVVNSNAASGTVEKDITIQ